MVELEYKDRNVLIELLQNRRELASERQRRQVLENAGLGDLAPHMDLSDPQYSAVSEIVSYLSSYGRLTYDEETLGQFLNVVKSFMGLQDQERVAAIMNKYNLMTPIAPSPDVGDWRGSTTGAEVQEKVIGENTLRPIAFLSQALVVARSVAYIGLHTGSGTGFLVTPDLMITNNHVIPSADLLSETVFRFNYEENWKGEAQPAAEYRAKPGGVFHTSQPLDYTVVQLDGEPGRTWGWLPLKARDVQKDERINIIQHAAGQPKKISLQNNLVEYVGGNVAQYVTSTLPGSSGSPVFNDRWEVVALHHAGGNLPEPTTRRSFFRNEGILILRVLADLPPNIRQLIDAAAT
ncbi:MAG: serine protease [Chloroflexota bacterium]|nr:serine protease [Chloroflexota bacterium]MDQ5866458.1 serine protease [Chloroflexota bacterium]